MLLIKKYTLLTLTIAFVLLGCDTQEKKSSDYAFAKASAEENKNSLSSPDGLQKSRTISQQFKDYWYAGTAEISSYRLEQARYGEMRDGTAVLVYVTEDFLPDKQVKADTYSEDNISVLKLNSTKNFNTGIYPYSIMTSTFSPVYKEQHAIKVTQSMQEWCGHVFMQLNNKKDFEVQSYSYFASEGDQKFELDKAILENDLWNIARFNPSELPTGNIKVIPAFEYIRMKHIAIKAYAAQATKTETSYTLSYPELGRSLTINFTSDFPHSIEGWEETFKSGYGASAKELTTTATRINTIQSPYWSKNNNADADLREELGLE